MGGLIGLLFSIWSDLLWTLTRPLRQLFCLPLHLCISVWSGVVNGILDLIVQAIRVLTAARREKKLVKQLNALRLDYEDTTLRNSELQKKLDAFMRDRRLMMDTLDLVTGDKKKALETTKALKTKVEKLQDENQRLIENEEDLRRGLAEAVARVTAANKIFAEHKYLPYEKSGLDVEFVQARDIASKTLNDACIKDPYQESNYETMSLRTHSPSSAMVGARRLNQSLMAESEQEVAYSSSVFSAMLSALVAVIAWEAQDPCTPLVIALFMVVGMSLANVVQWYVRIQSRQAFHAVALLSLNWFVLGTLARPALPYLGQFGSSIFWILSGWFLRLLGFGTVLKVSSYELPEL